MHHAVDESKLTVVVVVLAVEFGLQLRDDFIRHIFQLGLNQLPCGVPQFDQQPHTRCGGGTKGNLAHNGVLAVIEFAVTDTKAEVAYIGFGGDAGFDSAGFLLINVLKVKFSVQVGHRLFQHIGRGLSANASQVRVGPYGPLTVFSVPQTISGCSAK